MRKKNFLVILLLLLLAFISPQNINAAVEVSNDMTNEEIQNVISENDIITFKEGTYDDLSIVLTGNSDTQKTFILENDVIFNSTTGKGSGISVKGTNKNTINIKGSLTISGYNDNIILDKNSKLTLNILENASLSLKDAKTSTANLNHGNGIWSDYDTELIINGYKGSTFIASGNDVTGINILRGSLSEMNFKDAELVELSNNKKSSGYHTGMDGVVKSFINFDNVKKIRMSNNGWNGINVNYSNIDEAIINIINCNDVEIKNNSGWGINGGVLKLENSSIDASDNSTFTNPSPSVGASCSNIYVETFTRINSNIKANNAGNYSGIWVYGNAVINGGYIEANGNGMLNIGKEYLYKGKIRKAQGGYGLHFNGKVEITDATIVTNNNTKSGILVANRYGSESGMLTSFIKNSKVTSSNNGRSPLDDTTVSTNSQITLSRGNLILEDTQFYTDANGTELPNIGLGFDSIESDAYYIIKGLTVGAINSDDYKIFGTSADKRTYVLGGSFQTENKMQGEYNNWNEIKLDDEVYVAPINSDGTKLVRFNLNKEINLEVSDDTNTIIYFDPNTGIKYVYDFRYNKENEDLNEDEKDNAYVWTPVSVVNYDSTEGYIDYGNSTAGSLIMGSSITNQENNGKNDRYTSDITIIGNSLNLAEKIMPKAIRNGYIFLGWFYPNAEDAELASEYAKNGDFNNLYKLLVNPFDESTKILRDMNDISSAMGEITIYAKWAKLEDNIDKSGSDTVTSNTDVFDYNIKYSATVSEYSGDVTIMITDILQYSILEDMSDIDISNIILNHNYKYDITTKYDEVLKRIVWIINIYDVNTYENGILTIDIDKNLKLYYLNIDKSVVEVENIVKSSLIITNNDEDMIVSEKEDNHVTAILYKGGDIEELPPQTGVNSGNSLLSPILLMLLLIIRRVIK